MWEQVYATSKTQISKTFPINQEFSSLQLIVKATSGSANTTWRRAGYLQPIYLIPEIGQVKGKRVSLILGIQLISVPLLQPIYYFEYHFLRWFLDIDLIIWENPDLLISETANKDIENVLRRIEYKIDAIETYGNQ